MQRDQLGRGVAGLCRIEDLHAGTGRAEMRLQPRWQVLPFIHTPAKDGGVAHDRQTEDSIGPGLGNLRPEAIPVRVHTEAVWIAGWVHQVVAEVAWHPPSAKSAR